MPGAVSPVILTSCTFAWMSGVGVGGAQLWLMVQIQLHISKFYFVGRLNRSRRSFQSQSVRAKLHAHTHCHACIVFVLVRVVMATSCSYSMKCQRIQANWHTCTHTHTVNTRSSMKCCFPHILGINFVLLSRKGKTGQRGFADPVVMFVAVSRSQQFNT